MTNGSPLAVLATVRDLLAVVLQKLGLCEYLNSTLCKLVKKHISRTELTQISMRMPHNQLHNVMIVKSTFHFIDKPFEYEMAKAMHVCLIIMDG